MIGFLRNLFAGGAKQESIDDLEPSVRTSQVAIDTKDTPAGFLTTRFGLTNPFDLAKYLTLFQSDDLAHAIIQALTNLTVSDLVCKGDDNVCSFLQDFHREIDLDNVLYQICQSHYLHGASYSEIVGNGSTLIDSNKIVGIKVLDSRSIRIQRDPFGRILSYMQFPIAAGAFIATSIQRRLDPQTIVRLTNNNPATAYGLSVLQPILSQLTKRQDAIDAAIKAARNHANPAIHIHYGTNAEQPEDQDEINRRISDMKKAVDDLDEKNKRWLISGGRGTFTASAIGHTTLPDTIKQVEHITQSILVSAGLAPRSLGFSFGESVKDQQSHRFMVNFIKSKQRAIMSQLRTKLYDLLPFIDSRMPAGEFIIKMEEPTMESVKEQLEAEAIRINNVAQKWQWGVLTDDQGARDLGEKEIQNKEQWEKKLNAKDVEPNPNDPNAVQATTKALDTLGKGKAPSNNPTGGKG